MTNRQQSLLYHPTAYHEAGHAVVAHFLGVRLKKISIISGRDYVGIVHHEKVLRGSMPEMASPHRMEILARITLAGHIAQRIHAPRSRDGAWHDRELVADLALRTNGSEAAANAWIKWLKISVSDMLKSHWSFVDVVTHELVKRNELGRKQIVDLINRVPGELKIKTTRNKIHVLSMVKAFKKSDYE